MSRENLWTTSRAVPETAAQTAAQTAACSVAATAAQAASHSVPPPLPASYPALACLGLDVEQLAALARQGSLHAEGPGSRKRYYRLHFRQAGRQVVRYVGSNPGFVAAVRGELARLQARTKHSRDLERLVRASRRCLRATKRRLSPLLPLVGRAFYGARSAGGRRRASPAGM